MAEKNLLANYAAEKRMMCIENDMFFKGAHKVRMFPMYADDLNLDM